MTLNYSRAHKRQRTKGPMMIGSIEEDTKTKVIRCGWLTQDPLYIAYHDEEWGKPERDDFRLFEMLCLEGQQAGLSWITILKKRENYKKAFFEFNPRKISKMSNKDINKLVINPNIVRHKGKIEAIINNSKCFLKMQENGEDFSDFLWSFVNHEPIINNWKHHKEIPTQNSVSVALSKALKKRGFKYAGATITYAFMQACGLINDHISDCVCRTNQI